MKKVGVLDSGVGGFSILAKLEKEKLGDEIIYLADQANFPYSEKSAEQLKIIAKQNVSQLVDLGCELIIIACNTLTVHTIDYLRQEFTQIKFIGTVPAVKTAAEKLPPQSRAIVLSTKGTTNSVYLKDLVRPYQEQINFELVGTTKLVEAIESWDESRIIYLLQSIINPTNNKCPIGIVLGCTHFSFIKKQIMQICPQTKLFEPVTGIVKQVRLSVHDPSSNQIIQLLSTDDSFDQNLLQHTYKKLSTLLNI